ncbi:glycosyltransferase family 4 protein [uncultured Clostridium sp.]|uniref:glycosyltransferase family 4 protein n=1 Tax=uncultured Clostridium sp. TaxID=59620 RepID=UPI0025EA798D|nr:glycosyltransferase family 4 protein [uncultured Clostridium sp.]
MKRVLYITNIEVPYRVRFFNELAKKCELTVLYERRKSSNRDNNWSGSEKRNYRTEYLGGVNIGTEYAFSLKILKYIFGKYDAIIIGCYNSPVQMLAIMVMRILKIHYILSTDGEIFLNPRGIKGKIKKIFILGASKYLAAGEKAAYSLAKVVDRSKIEVYYFSSLYKREIENHAKRGQKAKRNDIVLVVGQYFDYKGMDVALQAAALDTSIQYKFVGMGKRTNLFIEEQNIKRLTNVKVIPFLTKDELEKEYETCAMLVLPTRQECWGLVVNEAASYGMPIISTWGSGAAVEFLADKYPEYLAEAGNAEELYRCITKLKRERELENYSNYLIEKGRLYNIEKSVEVHLKVI